MSSLVVERIGVSVHDNFEIAGSEFAARSRNAMQLSSWISLRVLSARVHTAFFWIAKEGP